MLNITFLCFSLIGELQRTVAILWCNFSNLKDREVRLELASGALVVAPVFTLPLRSSGLAP